MGKSRITFLLGATLVGLTLSGCASLKQGFDSSGLKDSAKAMEAAVGRFGEGRFQGPAALERELATYDPFALVDAPPRVKMTVGELDRWRLEDSRHDLHQERLSFPSVSPARGGAPDEAVYYLYYRGELRGKKAILWVPGYGVSDFAFLFIRRIFAAELDDNYAILFYSLPGHLERIGEGEKSGDGLLSADPETNLETVQTVLGELATGMNELRERGVSSFSAWGGSMGAAFLLILAERERFDHIALMIPVLDWNSIMGNAAMEGIRKRLGESGYPDSLVRRAYRTISPMYRTWNPGSTKYLIQYARYDRLTPEALTLAFAKARGIEALGYEESHATILLNGRMFADYRRFLDGLAATSPAVP
jgi:pimeloyl-ACP methyl ester carboxylesterase